MTELEKMLAGEDFDTLDKSIHALRTKTFYALQKFNSTPPMEGAELFKDIIGECKGMCAVMPPFHCEFGKTITMGDSVFINMGVTMLDNAPITLGNNILIGPNTQFYTPSHPLHYKPRRTFETTCLPITVEDDVWIGGNVVICQGVTIGARSVVAAGSVVTKDVPADTLVGGTPAKAIKSLNQTDNE
jgi:maltose O-acetyltransferase